MNDTFTPITSEDLEGTENPFLVPTGAVEEPNPFLVPVAEGEAPAEEPNPFLVPVEGTGEETPSVSVNVSPEALDALSDMMPGDAYMNLGPLAESMGPVKGGIAGVRNGAANAITLGGEIADAVGMKKLGRGLTNVADAVPPIEIDRNDPEQAISEEISRFLLGGGVATKLLKGSIKGEMKRGLVGGAIGDMAVSSSEDKRLMQSLVEEFPFLDTPITHYLAADDSSDVEARFKQALEGMMLSSTAHGVFTMVKYLKGKIGASVGKKMVTEPVTEEQLAEALEGTKAEARNPSQAEKVTTPETAEPLQPATTTKAADTAEEAVEATADATKVDDAVTTAADGVAPKATPERPKLEIEPAKRDMYFARMKQLYSAHGNFTGDISDMIGDMFNTNTMTSPDEVKVAMGFLEKMAGESVNKITGGVQSLETTKQMAEELADMAGAKNAQAVLSPLADLSGDANKMAARLVAGKQMMQWAADKVYRLSQVVDQRGGAAAEAEFLQAVDVLREITGIVKGAQTAAARMTSAGRIKTGIAGNLNMTPEELLQVVDGAGGSEAVGVLARRVRSAGANGKPKDIVKVLHQSILGRAIDIHNEVWINSILGGVKTNVVNMTSNMANTMLRPGEKWIGGQILDKTGKAVSALGKATGKDPWVESGRKLSQEGQAAYAEASAMYTYMRMGLMDTFNLAGRAGEMDIYGSGKSALRAFKDEANILDPAMKTNEFQNFAISRGDGVVLANWDKAIRGDREAGLNLLINGLGKTIRLPSRFLMAEDEFFKQLNARAHLFGQANRQATLKGFKQGSGEYADFVEDFFSKAFDQQTGRLLDDHARQWARESTFTQDLKTETLLGNRTMSETLSSAAGTHPLIRGTVLPFVRTPANLMRNLWDHTPVFGQLRKQFWTDITKGTPEQKAMAIGRLTSGAAMWSGAAMLAAEGHITGGGPQGNPALMAEMRATGWEPYSIKCKDGWVPVSRLDPFGSIFTIAADFVEMSGHISQETQDELALNMTVGLADVLEKYSAAAGTSFVNNVVQKSYLKGLIDTFTLFSRNAGQLTTEELFQRVIHQRVASYIPAYAQTVNQDEAFREVRSLLDAVKSRVPGLSASLPPKRDELGDVVTRDGEFIGGLVHSSAVWPFAKSDYKNDPVRDEIARLGGQLGIPVFPNLPKREGQLDYTELKNSQTGQTVYDRMVELMGTMTDGRGNTLKDALASTIAKQSYQRAGEGNATLPYSRKLEMLREVRSRYEERAWRALKKEPGFESFVQAQKAMTRNKRSVSFHGLDALIRLPGN
ncbi:hypothetical protein KL86APRO_30233 [uncultured Alphaproteobacteria bacterium]|uniref:Uncharacterized protein n=1 Tax=uncultured Alphaproteobacteria bacterium TaxID=91750 RepID=A0A212KM81_9PROT|nr:hypothetical protein KL86APRO_30233 [uncultured Alphaproteobacteria bacterium]